jgi:uncharacterized protein YndB with AHSA1/START domain
MPEILHTLSIRSSRQKVFEAVSTSKGLDAWWTKSSTGKSELGARFALGFGPGYEWEALVTKYEPGTVFELQMIKADPDWLNTKVGFMLKSENEITQLHFYHSGWQQLSEHFKASSYCWACYLRVLRRFLEYGEQVAYEKRPDA